MRRPLVALLLAGACAAASAQVTVPNTFTAGTPARAADVNANFQALATAINGLTSRVNKLEGQITAADLVGTYTINQFQTELEGGGGGHVAVYTGGGTVTLAANGTATLSGNVELGHQLNLGTNGVSTRVAINRPQPTGSVSWSLSGSTVTMLNGSFTVAAGGRMLIRSSANPVDGTNVLLLLTRTN